MKIQSFEDIIAWQKAKLLTLEVYAQFKNCRDFSFKDQIQRASLSVMNNIAEGFERQSNKELRKFLFIAKGSAGEVRSMLSVAVQLKYITPESCKRLSDQTLEISKLLSGFIKSL